MIKGYKGFLESKELRGDLLEYFLDIEDDFRVDIRLDTSERHFILRIVTLEGFKVDDLRNILISISGVIGKMKSIGDFIPRVNYMYSKTCSSQNVNGDTRKNKWGSIEGMGRVWCSFDDWNITDPEGMFNTILDDKDFWIYYPNQVRGLSIWMDFISSK